MKKRTENDLGLRRHFRGSCTRNVRPATITKTLKKKEGAVGSRKADFFSVHFY